MATLQAYASVIACLKPRLFFCVKLVTTRATPIGWTTELTAYAFDVLIALAMTPHRIPLAKFRGDQTLRSEFAEF